MLISCLAVHSGILLILISEGEEMSKVRIWITIGLILFVLGMFLLIQSRKTDQIEHIVVGFVLAVMSMGAWYKSQQLLHGYTLVGDPGVYQTYELKENQRVYVLEPGSRRMFESVDLWFEMFEGHGSSITAEGWVHGPDLVNPFVSKTGIKTKGGALLYSEPDGFVLRRLPKGTPVTINLHTFLVQLDEQRWMGMKNWEKVIKI